jgi:hypothetical protein
LATPIPSSLASRPLEASLLNDLGGPAGLAVNAPGIQRQGQGVNGLRWWMQQEPDDIESALLVFENRVPAFKGEFPEAQAPAQGIPAFVSRVTMGSFPVFHSPILA